jgi:cell pole-organizing protein PopZ
MSEIPVDTSNAHIDGEEPSMEDILASIRKIIADDQPQSLELDETDLGDGALDLSIEAVEAHERKMEELEFGTPPVTQTLEDISEARSHILEPADMVEDVELVNIVDDSLDAVDVPDIVVGLDEQLDLVVDTEATEFVEMDIVQDSIAVTDIPSEPNGAVPEEELVADTDDEIEKIYANFQDMEIERDAKIDELSEPSQDMDSSTEDLIALLQSPEEPARVSEDVPEDLTQDLAEDLPESLDVSDVEVSGVVEDILTDVNELVGDVDMSEDDGMSEDDEMSADDDSAAGNEFIDFEIDLPLQDIEAHELSTAAAEKMDLESEPRIRAPQEDDIDLVKALLADLMEDEIEEDPTAEALESAEDVDDADENSDEQIMSVFDDILDTSVAAQEEVQEEASHEGAFEESFSDDTLADIFAGDVEGNMPENTVETDLVDSPEEAGESELAKIARLASEAAQNIQKNMAHANQEQDESDDFILPETDLSSRLHLMSSLNSDAVPELVMNRDEIAQDIEEVFEPADDVNVSSETMPIDAADDFEKITALLGGGDEEDIPQDMVFAPEDSLGDDGEQNLEPNGEDNQESVEPIKEEVMAKAAKKDAIMSEETEKDAGSAFASLSSAVQEKTQAEESGPPIGDLVQEALRPMLQEWLDKNLKGIVERAVTKEVKRIASGK